MAALFWVKNSFPASKKTYDISSILYKNVKLLFLSSVGGMLNLLNPKQVAQMFQLYVPL